MRGECQCRGNSSSGGRRGEGQATGGGGADAGDNYSIDVCGLRLHLGLFDQTRPDQRRWLCRNKMAAGGPAAAETMSLIWPAPCTILITITLIMMMVEMMTATMMTMTTIMMMITACANVQRVGAVARRFALGVAVRDGESV